MSKPVGALRGVDATMLPICSVGDCGWVREQLLDLEAFWIPRHPRYPFHTLGATNYYDLAASIAKPYVRLALQYNALLRECFARLYEGLLDALQAHLRAPVTWLADSRDAAMPGFHLFRGHPHFGAGQALDTSHAQWLARRDGDGFPGNPVHVDTAHLALGLEGATLSFTLPIALPPSGAGMRVWSLQVDRSAGGEAGLPDGLLQAAHFDVHYRPGELWLHDGKAYHKALGLPTSEADERFTLQGHGVWNGQAWQLFW